jgi:glycosyltransferase involved in cell wall biosynthesis
MISIITPVLNGEKHIEACLQHVIDQKCSDIEHIIVDGLSIDNTIHIVKSYADHHPHIKWISEKDSGQSNAMNKGISLAEGRILNILNVDDYYQPGVLNKIAEIFEGLPEPSFLVGNCNILHANGDLKKINEPNRLGITDLLLGLRLGKRFGVHPVNPSAYFYHSSLHRLVGPYDEHEHYAMDVDFILKAVQAAHVEYVDEIWGNFRLLEGTKTVTDKHKGLFQARKDALFRKHLRLLPRSQRVSIMTQYWCALWKKRVYQALNS